MLYGYVTFRIRRSNLIARGSIGMRVSFPSDARQVRRMKRWRRFLLSLPSRTCPLLLRTGRFARWGYFYDCVVSGWCYFNRMNLQQAVFGHRTKNHITTVRTIGGRKLVSRKTTVPSLAKVISRFLSSRTEQGKHECWIWNKSTTEKGYGQVMCA